MSYELIKKSSKGNIIPQNKVRISSSCISFSRDIQKAFILKRKNEIIKYSYALFYYDEPNKKLKIVPTDDYINGYVYRRNFQNFKFIRRLKLEYGVYDAFLNKNNEIEINFNKKIDLKEQ